MEVVTMGRFTAYDEPAEPRVAKRTQLSVKSIEGEAMRLPRVRHEIPRLMLVGALVALGGPESLACSGPGAARVIRESELIGWSLAGISIASVAGGCSLVRRRSPGHRIRWIVAPLALHPRLWMDAVHGDCGHGLRWWSFVATLGIAVAVALAICWPRPAEAGSKKWRWALSGALAGTVAGLLIAALILEGPGSMSAVNVPLAVSALCSTVIAGALVGGGLFRLRTRDGQRFRFGVRTLLLLPFVLAPLFVALLPVLPYQASVSATSPFSFVVVDESTGRPIPNAAVRLIDPRFALDDTENQGERVVTGADGSVDYILSANVRGREGLLGRTETISYNPWLIRVEALGYRPYFTSLASDSPIPADRLTAPPLGLTFPPPPTVTIRLSPSTSAAGAEDKSDRHPLAP
jgi:hypothetical protein